MDDSKIILKSLFTEYNIKNVAVKLSRLSVEGFEI